MAHFYAQVSGRSRTKASRLGTKSSGITTKAASWQGAVAVWLYERDGVDYARVELVPHHGAGTSRPLYHGPVGGAAGSCASALTSPQAAGLLNAAEG